MNRFKAAVLTLMGYPIEMGPTDPRLYRTINANTAGQVVNENTAMTVAAVYACVRLISQTVASLPFHVYRRTDDGREEATDHPVEYLINRLPNPDTISTVFWQAVVTAMLLRGGAYIEKSVIGPRPVKLKFLSPNRLSISSIQGVKQYRYTEANGSQREIPASRIIYIPYFTLDGENGVSAIEYGAGVIGSALAANNAANKQFESGLQPTVYIKNPTAVKKEQRKQFRESMAEIVGAVNAGEPVVLEVGQDIGTISINSKDAQLLESRSFSVEQVCSWFGVPPFMIGHTTNSTSWGTGIEQQNIGFLTYTLLPILTNIAKVVNNTVMPPADRAEYYAEHLVESLLRADMAGRANYYTSLITAGVMARDEARRKENLPSMGGNAAILTVNPGITPLDQIGQPVNESE